MKATCFNMRDTSGNKIMVGTAYCSGDLNEAADNLIKGLDVGVTASGKASFMYKGKPVNVYLSVDPSESEKGRNLEAEYRKEKRAKEAQVQKDEEEYEEKLFPAIQKLGADNALEILTKAAKEDKA